MLFTCSIEGACQFARRQRREITASVDRGLDRLLLRRTVELPHTQACGQRRQADGRNQHERTRSPHADVARVE